MPPLVRRLWAPAAAVLAIVAVLAVAGPPDSVRLRHLDGVPAVGGQVKDGGTGGMKPH